jgi:hypothetical protein
MSSSSAQQLFTEVLCRKSQRTLQKPSTLKMLYDEARKVVPRVCITTNSWYRAFKVTQLLLIAFQKNWKGDPTLSFVA